MVYSAKTEQEVAEGRVTDVTDQGLASTIVACSTAQGRAGIAVVRVAGPMVPDLIKFWWPQLSIKPRQMQLGAIFDIERKLIDEVLWVCFPGPNSYTGDDVLELHGHGNPILVDAIIATCIALGCCMAEPGEFTRRAFLHGRMDLTQSEAVADLIDAHSRQASSLALRSLSGHFGGLVDDLLVQLTELRVYVEASIDFVDEDIDFLAQGQVRERLVAILERIESLYNSAQIGARLREGITVALIGPPNAGKSSLFNRLLGCDQAIVTDIAGTTRDVLERQVRLGDAVITLADTAGMRDTDGVVESIGVQRAHAQAQQADICCVVFDATQVDLPAMQAFVADNLGGIAAQDIWILMNKSDLLQSEVRRHKSCGARRVLYTSALDEAGLQEVIEALKCYCGNLVGSEEQVFIARRRHIEALDKVALALRSGLAVLDEHAFLDLLADELRVAQQALGSITGQFTNDALLGKIFAEFCIGK